MLSLAVSTCARRSSSIRSPRHSSRSPSGALPIPGADDHDLRVLIKRTRAKKNEDALQREVDAFVAAVAGNTPPLVGGLEATVALELAEEIARQAGQAQSQ